MDVSPSDLLLTSSTSEAYAFLFKILMDPGDRVLLPRPSYPLFDDIARLEALGVDHYRLVHEGSWSLDMESLEKAITSRTKAVLAVHPGNPTGSYLKADERERLVEICSRYQIALIVDEVFLDFPIDARSNRAGTLVGEQRVMTFVMSGLSKVAGLPQMKLSWIWTGGPAEPKEDARSRLEHVSDIFLSVSTPVQQGLEHFLAQSRRIQTSIATRITSNYRFLQEVAQSSPVTVLDVEGGWYVVLRLPAVVSSEEWALRLLRDQNVHVHPGYLFDFATEPFLVMSLLPAEADFQAGISRLRSAVEVATSHRVSRGD
jgi:aspartate/methionine/tyrosine aminotransferase